MLKLIKKSLVMLVALSMMIGMLSVPAFAEGEALAPAETTLLAPPAGTYTSLSFGLNDADGNALENTSLSIGSGVSGIYKNGTDVILDGDEITAGTFDLTATNGSLTATQNMTVNELLYYEDFEDVEVGANANTTRLNKLDGSISTSSITTSANTVLVASDGTTKYADTLTAEAELPIDLSAFASNCSKLTIEAMVKRGYNIYPITLKTTDSVTATLRFYSSNAAYWKYSNTTKNLGYNMATSGGAWEKIIIKLDLINGTIDTFIGGIWRAQVVVENWKGAKPSAINFGFLVDEVAIYSGSAYTLPSNTISGDSNIFAPESGEYTKHNAYKVTDSDGAEIANATISLTNDLGRSLKMMNNALAVSGEKATGGTTTLIAKNASGDFLAKKKVAVLAERYFEDFEDAEEDAVVTTAKLTKLDGTASDLSIASTSSTATIENEDDRGNYVNCADTMSAPTMSVDLSTIAADSSNIVITAKIRPDASTAGRIWMGKPNNTSIGEDMFEIRSRTTGSGMYSFFNEEGTYVKSPTNRTTNAGLGNWEDFKVEIDFSTKTYSLYIGNRGAMNNWKMHSGATTDGERRVLHFGMDVDDITIYSGEKLFLETETKRVSIPAEDNNTYTVEATYNDGTAVSNLQVISDELSADGNVITVIPSDEVKPYIVTLSDGFVKTDVKIDTDKDFIMVNGNKYDESTQISSGENTISAYYGASDLPSGRNIVIAHYGTDTNGSKYLKDVKTNESDNIKELSATLDADLAEGDIVKVFVWIWNTLVPIKSTNIE